MSASTPINAFDPRHAHERDHGVPPVLADDGACLVCRMLVAEQRQASARASHRRGWQFTTMTHVDHSADCECEQADGWSVETVGDTCTEGETFTAAILHHEFVRWAIDLDRISGVISRWDDLDRGHDGPAAILITEDLEATPFACDDPSQCDHSLTGTRCDACGVSRG